MKEFTLPMPLGSIDSSEEICIDMSKPNFPTSPELQIRSSILFIRNTALVAKFDFSKCTYAEKSEYLMTYMTETYRLSIKELTSTWVAILAHKYGYTTCQSILNPEEISQFTSEHNEMIDEMLSITASIPIYAMMCFFRHHQIAEFPDIEKSDYLGINGWNFFNMLDNDSFINLIQIIDGISPKYYTNYFVPSNKISDKIIKKLPYYSLMEILFDEDESAMNELFNIVNDMTGETNK